MFGDDDHSHPVLGCLTILNTLLVIGLLYVLLSNGTIDLRELPFGQRLADLAGGIRRGGEEATPTVAVPTPTLIARATPTRALPTASPTPRGIQGGDTVRVRRAAEFRSAPEMQLTPFCQLSDEMPGLVLKQDPAKATDQAGRTLMVYPVEVRDASCEGGAAIADLKGWVTGDFLRRP